MYNIFIFVYLRLDCPAQRVLRIDKLIVASYKPINNTPAQLAINTAAADGKNIDNMMRGFPTRATSCGLLAINH